MFFNNLSGLEGNQMTKLEAIRDLCKHDHAFLKKEYVEKLGKIFGIKIGTRIAHSDPAGTFKGLSLYDDKGNPIEKAEGRDADIVAHIIAIALKADHTEMGGRGSELRDACEAVEKYLIENKIVD